MGTLKVTDGKLDLKSVESLSRRELGEWIDARLHGQDTQVPGDARQGDMPHYLIKLIYPNLDRSTRQDIENTTLDFVRDMARNPNTVWRGDAADELLLLAQSIGSNKAVTYLREMAEDRRYFHSEQQERAGDIHYRLLQSLVSLGWRGASEFWKEQAHLSPDRYAGVAFDGLALIAPEDAIALLSEIPWSDKVEDQILISLPYLLETHEVSRIVSLLSRYLADLPERAKAVIKGFLEEEGLSPEPVHTRGDLSASKNVLTADELGWKEEKAISALVQALRDKTVRSAAVLALGWKEEKAISALVQALRDKTVRSAAVLALGEMGEKAAEHPDVIPALVIALRDQDADKTVRSAAVSALGKLQGPGERE